MRNKKDNHDKLTKWVNEVLDITYGRLGGLADNGAKLMELLIGCEELYTTNRMDKAITHPVELGYSCSDLLKLQTMLESQLSNSQNYDWDSSGYIRKILMTSLGHALIEFGGDYDYSEFASEYEDEALATACGMKLSSYLIGLKSSTDNSDVLLETKINFAKTRRGYTAIEYYHSAHCVDDYVLSPSPNLEFLQNELNSRAEYRKRKLPLQQIFNTTNENDFSLALTAPENATTVANILSLHPQSFLMSLEETQINEVKSKIRDRFRQVANIPPATFNVEIEKPEAKIDTVGFINLVSTHGYPHEAYKGNKKLITYTLESGVEIGIEQAAKKVTFWIAQQYITEQVAPFIKNIYSKVSKESETYGRHSGLRMYGQLAWDEVAKLSISNIGEAKKVLGELNSYKVNS
ncbi:hypothetical protein [Shewanella youngdeokensis]|uniref:Uncharacterized protein n=1 Tax=Shewanella youngdeokensis TaxID=2999068 RepID=A0ABZ0JYN8_9GAMM|nr:hypothetical protein RGE70_00745 [Shewanella sp. DAU334]